MPYIIFSNPAVQKIAVKNDVGKNLLSLLYHKSTAVVSKVMFALASYLRNFPEAQDDIFARNGISQLADVLKSQKLPTRIKLKIINLFSDLSVEFVSRNVLFIYSVLFFMTKHILNKFS